MNNPFHPLSRRITVAFTNILKIIGVAFSFLVTIGTVFLFWTWPLWLGLAAIKYLFF
jgi:hypothetical protein